MHFSTIALVGRYHDSGLDAPLRALADVLHAAGRQVLIEKETSENTGVTEYPTATTAEIGSQADLVIVMGGDGTMLGVGRQLAQYDVPLLGINHGRLGFITDIPVQNAFEAIESVLDGQYDIERRTLLQASVVRNDETLTCALALNDVVLNRASRGGMIEICVEYNETLMYRQRADGLIVATPTGSTAYSLSASGPILHPAVNAFLLVPVAPQTLSNRPIAVPDTGTLTLTLSEVGRVETGASVHFDMQTWSDLQLGDKIVVTKADHQIRFLHPKGYNFFSTLRQKLHWNIMPDAS